MCRLLTGTCHILFTHVTYSSYLNSAETFPVTVNRLTYCGKCHLEVALRHRQIECSHCRRIYHNRCVFIPNINSLERNPFICYKCQLDIFPFYTLEDDEFIEINFPFKSFDLDLLEDLSTTDFFTPQDQDHDPDSIFPNISSKYLTPDELNFKLEQLPDKEYLTIFHANTVSLPAKMSALKDILHFLPNPFDVLAISETRLSENTTVNVEIPEIYNPIITNNSETAAGGTALYIKKGINFIERKDLSLNINDCEDLWFEILDPKNEKNNIVVAVIYRHPRTTLAELHNFQTKLNNSLEKINSEKKVGSIFGDININLLKHSEHGPTGDYLNMIFSNSFFPTITRPTRIPKNSFKAPTLIDHIYTNSLNPNVESGICLFDISDHLPVFTAIPFSKTYKRAKYQKRCFSNFNVNQFKNDLSKKLDTFIEKNANNEDPNFMYNSFSKIFRTELDHHAPLRTITNRELKRSLKPWITNAMYKSIRRKQKMYKTHYLSGIPQKIEFYKKYSNTVNRVNFVAKKKFYEEKFESLKNDIKGTWKLINKIITTRSNRSSSFTLKINNNLIQDPKIIANHFGEFYQNVGPSLAKNIPETASNYKDFLSDPITKNFNLDLTNETEVYETIMSLKKKKSMGFDQIPTKIIQISASIISPSLSMIFNCSFRNHIFPDALKIAKIIPIFKSGVKEKVSNYRPISILSVLAKVIEKLVFKRLMNHINRFNILYNHQFGFREKHGTLLALFELTDLISKTLDSGGYAAGLFLDLSKAFDTVDHTILLGKLENYGIRGHALKWFESYLSNRKHYVEIENTSSKLFDVYCGVPQGSILGPILFLLYINDLPNCSKLLLFRLFADDTAVIFKHDNLQHLVDNLNTEISKVNIWLKANKLSLNTDKTKLIIFHSHRKKILTNFNVSIDGFIIKRYESLKYLGIFIDEHLNWKKQLSIINTKLSKTSGLMAKLRHFCNLTTLKCVYYSLFYPYILYGIICWGCALPTYLKPLQILQNKTLRIMTFSDFQAPSNPLYLELNFLKIDQVFQMQSLLLMYKFHHSLLPPVFDDYFTPVSNLHSHFTRYSSNNYLMHKTKNNYGRYSPSNIILHLWSEIDNYTKTLPIGLFKSEVIEILKFNYIT